MSVDLAWYHLKDDNSNKHLDNAVELEREETHTISVTYGALVDYKIKGNWGLQAGVTIANTNITVDPKIIYAQKDNFGTIKYRFNTSSGYGYLLPTFILALPLATVFML